MSGDTRGQPAGANVSSRVLIKPKTKILLAKIRKYPGKTLSADSNFLQRSN
jgi:hypothetical protein